MVTRYFLGANSAKGFASLYNDFCAGEGDFLYIVKAGPGGGKSGFMRRIGEEAARRGLDVEQVLCSGDPASLDGIYIPSMHIGFADGTAPHVLEPRHQGVDGCYVNLGRFCSTEPEESAEQEICRQTAKYKAQYERAYGYLAAANELRESGLNGILTEALVQELEERSQKAIAKLLNGADAAFCGGFENRFISAFSCDGIVDLTKELCKPYAKVFHVESKLGLAQTYLEATVKYARAANTRVIACRAPLRTKSLDAVFLPELSAAFVTGPCEKTAHRVRLDFLIRYDAMSVNTARRQYAALIGAALSHLALAKGYHDALEAAYKPFIDFAGLTAYTDKTIERIFK